MSFAELVSRLGFGTVHILFAQQISHELVCEKLVQEQMHLDDITMKWIIDDFIEFGLLRRHSDPNFIAVDAKRIMEIQAMLEKKTLHADTNAFLSTMSHASLVSPNFETLQVRLHSPPKEEEPSRYPSFRLSRSGWQGGKTSHRHR